MFFRIFNQPKNKLFRKVITLILLNCFIIALNGCTTTSKVKYSNEKLTQNKIYKEISYIILKDGSKVITKGKEVAYEDSINALVIVNYDTIISGRNKKILKTNSGIYDTIESKNYILTERFGRNTIIPVNEVMEVFVEKTETNAGLTTLFVIGVIAGIALFTVLIKNATEPDIPPTPPTPPPEPPPPPPPTGSCPLVYSFDGEKYVFDSEPISGVISEGMTRTDYSRMEFLNQSDGMFKLLIKNQPDETEMLDELKLVCVPHEENTFVTPNPEGEFFNYKTLIRPESVTDENGNDVSVFFNEKDNIRWQTQMPVDTSFIGGTEKHKLKFRFPKPEGAENALLFVNCGTAYWGANMIRIFMQLKGDKIDEWYTGLYPGGKELQKLYMFLGREELFTLNVNLLEGDKFIARTFIPAGGPLMDEDRIIRLPLKNVTGDYVEINLNPPPGFWKIDQIGIIYDYEIIRKDKIQELDAVYAADQDGRDIKTEIKKADKNYYIMPEEGNYSNVYYNAPLDFNQARTELFLKTTGYYELYIDKGRSEQTALVEELMTTPGKIIQYSMTLYNQHIKSMAERLKIYRE